MSNTGTYKIVNGEAVKISDSTTINIDRVINNKELNKTIPLGGIYMPTLGEYVKDTEHFNSILAENNLEVRYNKA